VTVKLSDYEKIVGREITEEIYLLAEKVRGKSMKMVNSTSVGGGVAEILAKTVPIFNELGINTKWDVIKGNDAFYSVTKSFHNALHGMKVDINDHMFQIFNEVNDANINEMTFDEDAVIIHDPQPAGLIKKKGGNKWVWRCHIDVSHPDMRVWEFLKTFIKDYDASIFSSPSFSKALPIPQFLVYPAIDPLSDKNKELPDYAVDRVLRKYKIPKDKPIITQISRFDRLKDPLGVIEAYKIAKRHTDCQLILAGGGATDDPEAGQVLAQVNEKASSDPDIHILTLPPFSDIDINALQRASAIVIQKSIREGFGLTVTEALWKGRPVIGGAVGGIPLQIMHNLSGILVHSIEGCAYQIRYLLSNPEYANRLGQFGREVVREKFLITRIVRNYILLLIALHNPKKNIIEA
jgi:trehalose synthase